MAKAKKLPSGSWRCLAYSHTEEIRQPDGTTKKKRIYESFTSDDPSPRGKKEAELAAAQFQANKDKTTLKKRADYGNMTLTEAIDKYIESRESLNRSPTTIAEYKCTQKNAFQDIMSVRLRDIDEDLLQDAINAEAHRPSNWKGKNRKPISAKRLKNEWGLIRSTLHKYAKHIHTDEIDLPVVPDRIVELPSARDIIRIVRGSDIELPVLLAMWLSFSASEVRGLTKSKSLSPDGNYLTIREVVVNANGKDIRKSIAKNNTRNRRHRIPPYIQNLIAQVDGDVLVPISGVALYHRWIRLQEKNGMAPITFHDLRHLSASVMALLRIPDKYAQERGGWKSDEIMKKVYMQTFSEERVRVDDLIDGYFEDMMQHEMQHETEKVP